MYETLIFTAGVLAWPILKIVWFLLYCLKWACKDTWWVIRNGELEDGYSKWCWLKIVPNEFIHSFWQTATSIGTRVS